MELPFAPDKEFFSVREAARAAQVPAHTLRYWESRFGDLRPARRPGGHRRYTRADLALVLEIKDLLQRRKMTIAGARRALAERKRGRPILGDSAPADAPAARAREKLLRELRRELRAVLDEF